MRKGPPTALIMTGAGIMGFMMIAIIAGVSGSSTPPASEAVKSPAPPRASASPRTRVADVSTTPAVSGDSGIRADEGLDYVTLKAESEAHLSALLKDEKGVRYRGVQTRLSTMDGGGIVAFCGEVNGKNALGAYAGFSRFIASRSVAIIEEQMTQSDFEQAWQRFCIDGVQGPRVWF